VTERYPNIFGIIEEVIEGFTVTIYLRAAPDVDGATLLVDQAADTIDEARGVIRRIAKERSIPEPDIEIEIRLFDLGPTPGPTN
jgi:hypothetical protein